MRWICAAMACVAAASQAAAAPPVEQDCPSGRTAHEVFASGAASGGDLTVRLHFCVRDAADGARQLEMARRQTQADPFISDPMRASLLRQIDAKLAAFRAAN